MELVRGNQNEQENSDPQGHSKKGKWKKTREGNPLFSFCGAYIILP